MKFEHFPHISQVPDFLSLMSFGNSWGNSYMPSLKLIISHRFACDEVQFGETTKSLKILSNWLSSKYPFALYVLINN